MEPSRVKFIREDQFNPLYPRSFFLTLVFFISVFSFSQKKFEKELNAIVALYDSGKFEVVIKKSNELLAKEEKKLSKLDKSILYSNIGLSYADLNNETEAEKYLLSAVEELKDSTEDTKYQHAMYKYYLASFYNHQGRYAEADPYYRSSLGLLAVAFGQTSKRYCMMYHECAQMYVEMGRFSEAYPMINASIYFYRVLFGEKDKQFLSTLNDMARIYQGTGNYKYASLYFDTILVTFGKYHKDAEPEKYATMVNNAGENYRMMAEYDLAEQYLLEALKLSEKFPLDKATTLNNIGLLYKGRGMYNEAERSFNESINIYNQAGKGNSLDVTNSYNGIGDLYRVTGRYRQAIAAFQKVVNIRIALGGTHHTNFANVLMNIALTYSEMNGFDEAEKLMDQAYKIYSEMLGENHVLTANCLNNMGMMKLARHDLDGAETLKLKAIDIYKNIVGEKNDRYAMFLSGMMMLYVEKKQPEKAMEYLEKAEKILKENSGGDNYDYYHILFDKAELYRKMNQPEKSEQLFYSAIEGYKKLLREFFPYMNEDEKTSIYDRMAYRFESFANYVFEAKQSKWKVDVNKLVTALTNFQLVNKSSLLNETADFQRKVYASNDKNVIDKYEYLIEMKKFICNKYRMQKDELIANGIYVDSLEVEAGKLEKELNTALKSNSSPTEITWKDVASKLSKTAAAIEIVRTKNVINDSVSEIKYAALIMKNGAAVPQLVLLNDGNKSDGEWLDEYRLDVEEKKLDTKSYNRYWKSLDASLKGIKDVYFSGDGVYLQLSLNSLLNPLTSKYLLEEKDIHVVTNTKDMLNSVHLPSTNKNGIFFGYPDYEFDFVAQRTQQSTLNNTAIASRFGFSELPALPGTKKEVNDVAKVFSEAGFSATSFMAEKATEKNVKNVKGPLVLHIATHGFFLPDVETDDEKILGFSTEKIKQNPLLRSGLMMAGASVVARDTAVLLDRDDDGILTAYEASLLNLQGTELVVLSACQTGLGETFNGQGVYGLQRAFLIAGARSLIMSMWVVDDYATQELMVEFYTEWLKNPIASNKLPSFKKAQLKIKTKYKEPFYWAAFVLLER